MPRYFFDIHDHVVTRDEEGIDLGGPEEIAEEIKRLLPRVALSELPTSGDRQLFTILVTDASKKPVYVATLSYNGILLSE